MYIPPEEVVKNYTDPDMAIFTCHRVVKRKLEQQKDILPESDPDDWNVPVSVMGFCKKRELNKLVVYSVKSGPSNAEPCKNSKKNHSSSDHFILPKSDPDDRNVPVSDEQFCEKSELNELVDAVKMEPCPELLYFNLEDDKFTIEEIEVQTDASNAELNNTGPDPFPFGFKNKPEMVKTNRLFPMIVDRNQPKNERNIKAKRKYIRKPVYCKLCKNHFKTPSLYKGHNCKHFSCDVCSKSYKRKDDLARHMECHFEQKPFPCGICHQEFKAERCLRQHMRRRHLNKNEYTCPICQKCFPYKFTFTRHMLKH